MTRPLPNFLNTTVSLLPILAAGVLTFLAFTMAGCSAPTARADTPPPPAAVTVAAPLVQSAPEWSEHPGRFVAAEAVDVRPRVSGYLQAVHFKDGDYVQKGQLLFTIDPLPFKARTDKSDADLAQADARLERARSDLRRAEILKASDAISAEEFDSRKEALAQAVAARQGAQASLRADALDLGYTKVFAPISGRISDRRIDPGNLVQSGETVLTQIVAVDPIHFEFSAPEGLLTGSGGPTLTGAGGRQALLQLEGETGYSHSGKVDFVDNRVDPGTGTIRGRAVFANVGGAFTPGQFGRVRVLTQSATPVVLAPETAIGSDQSRKYVLVVNARNVVEYRPVELGPQLGSLRVIRHGLSGSDRIVVIGLQRATPGQAVRPLPSKIAAADAAHLEGQG